MSKIQDNQNMATEKWINAKGQENHVCISDFHYANPGLRVCIFLVGYGLSNSGVGGHT